MRSHAVWCAAIGVFESALLTGALSAGTLEVRAREDHTGNPLVNAEVSVARVGAVNLVADPLLSMPHYTRITKRLRGR
jgi:hypothetical protein